MNEHKLLDDIADSVANNQDEIAEMCQGLYGKIKLNELKPKRYNITNSKKLLADMLRDTKSFYSSIKGRELTGVRSVVESFIGELNKFVYLMDMCIKEDIKTSLKPSLNESNNSYEDILLRETIKEAIKNTLQESSYDVNGNFNDEQHNDDLKYRLKEEVHNFNESLNDTLISLNNIAQMATDDKIKNRTRVIINALLNAGREMRTVNQLINADRWDTEM